MSTRQAVFAPICLVGLLVAGPHCTAIDAQEQPASGVAPSTQPAPQASAGGAQTGSSLDFDTKGVDFGPWVREFVAHVKRNWQPPLSVMKQKGHVVVTFNVHKDGSVTDITVIEPSPIELFGTAAVAALKASNPTEPLPPSYPNEKAFFTVTFYYNERPPESVTVPSSTPASTSSAAAPWPPPGVYLPADEGIVPPQLLHQERPRYTPEATEHKIEGTVQLEGVVKLDGTVTYVHVTRSLDRIFGLDEEAIKAARDWRFAPGTRMGTPVPVVVKMDVVFSLGQ